MNQDTVYFTTIDEMLKSYPDSVIFVPIPNTDQFAMVERTDFDTLVSVPEIGARRIRFYEQDNSIFII